MRKIVFAILFTILVVSVLFTLCACGDEEITVYDAQVYAFNAYSPNNYLPIWSVSGNMTSLRAGNQSDYLLEECYRYGFNFEGIFSRPDGQGEMYMDKNGVITKNFEDAADSQHEIMLYAHYTANTFSIPLSHYGGDSTFEFDFFSKGAPLPTADAPDHYDHVGWRVPGSERVYKTLPEEIILAYYTQSNTEARKPTLEAVYRGSLRKVSFNSSNDTLGTNSVQVYYDEPFTIPVPIAPAGKLFAGWAYDGVKITDRHGNSLGNYNYTFDISVNATYGDAVTVSFDVESNEGLDKSSCEILETETATCLAPFRSGYQFDRMDISSANGSVSLRYDEIENMEASCGSQLGGIRVYCTVNRDGSRTFEIRKVTTDLSVKIYYTPALTVLEKVSQDVIVADGLPTLSYGEKFSLPIAYKGGYRFDGWKIAGTDSAITDKDGQGLAAWNNQERTVGIEPIWVADTNAPGAITDFESLLAIKNAPGGKYILLNDITISEQDSARWTPFAFSGVLDGFGHKIKGLTLHAASGSLGMFTTVSGTVKNLTLENVSVTSLSNTKVNVGALCATLTGTVENVTVYGSVSADNANIGGICGTVNGGRIKSSGNYASVTTNTLESGAVAGGIAAYITNGLISGCENCGEITAFANVGGIVGHADGANNVTQSSNFAKINAGSGYVGGCVGKITASKFGDGTVIFNNLSNTADITADGSSVGGIIGYCSFYGDWWESKVFTLDFHRLTNAGNVEGLSHVGGCIGYATSSTGVAAYHPQIAIKLTDLVNTGDITAENIAGGCVGYGYNSDNVSKITRSSSSGKITVKHTAGGIAGYMTKFAIDSCDNTGTVIHATSYYIEDSGYYVRIGGFAGVCTDITNCKNLASIEYAEKGCCIGGVAGVVTATISKCSNEGNITAPKASAVGGVVGRISHSGNYNLSKLTNSGNITANESVGGIIGAFNCYFTFNDSSDHMTAISELASSGDVYSYGGFCGGIFGKLEGEAYDHDMRFPKFKVVVTFIECSGSVTCESPLASGALIGYASTDSDGSIMDAYSFTGKHNGADATIETLVGSKNKFTIVES